MSKNKKIGFGLILVTAAIFIMFFSTMPSAGSKEVTIAELEQHKSTYKDEYIMTQGLLSEESVEWNPDEIILNFELYEEGSDPLPVRYEGVQPDNFSKDVIVIIEGFMRENGVFEAEKVQTKCPSKYEGEDMKNYDQEMHKKLYNDKSEQ
ncbi:hypothetical protein CU633_00300 [Bacillus sp. V3-13]|uniref:cytochrome c maturation protein CcmE n=1 Tax=Bacillus sp. V3-13 TaxID=2053728 RepID=UPI000C794AE2|nr:cytochrome c maturation protein CcmE [Bacillus sp. V3-13]PLR79451.1 hypothetical protein CU633_00300 [Bacillus sp. V3-13]